MVSNDPCIRQRDVYLPSLSTVTSRYLLRNELMRLMTFFVVFIINFTTEDKFSPFIQH